MVPDISMARKKDTEKGYTVSKTMSCMQPVMRNSYGSLILSNDNNFKKNLDPVRKI